MADLDEEIAATRSAYVGAAVTEIASLRAQLSARSSDERARNRRASPRASTAQRASRTPSVACPALATSARRTHGRGRTSGA
jgi:hypothetical protein